MRSGMGSPTEGDVRLRCPLFLFDRETVGELEVLLRDLRGGGYTPLSLRELFRCRRGLRPWPPRPCAVLLREVPFEALSDVLPLAERWETPVGLFCLTPYGEREKESLRASRWLQFYGDADATGDLASLLPDGKDLHIAAFCEVADARAEGFLREKRIWMAVTPTGRIGALSGGVDLLYALPVERGNRLPELLARWHRAFTEEEPEVGVRLEEPMPQAGSNSGRILLSLPLAMHLPATDLPVAAYLGILGDSPELLAATDWNPVFDPSDGSYRLCPSGEALAERHLEEPTPAALLRALEEGSYLLLCRRTSPADGLLLFGYDGGRDVFSGMTTQPGGGYERADFRPATLETYCASCRVTCLTPDRSKLSLPRLETMIRVDAEYLPAEDGVLHGWSASVAFANRVSGGGTVSAASLRAFLEERLFNASRFRYLCERENLYGEGADRYLALLETEGKPVLQALQEQDGEPALPGIGPLLLRLLNAEEGCRHRLSEGLERMQALRDFRAEKTAKKNKMF